MIAISDLHSIPFPLIKRVLYRMTPSQLTKIETLNPHLLSDTEGSYNHHRFMEDPRTKGVYSSKAVTDTARFLETILQCD